MTTWLPLESNPDILNMYIHQLGVAPEWSVVDVFGLDEEMLEWVPKPVKALILLFPTSETYENHRREEAKMLETTPVNYPSDLFYMKQVIHNACGTIALVHAVANNKDITLKDGVLKAYLEKSKDMTPEERGKLLENDSAFTITHQTLAQEGQTDVNQPEVNHHFVALVEKNGVLFELDGRKTSPISHGTTTPESFLKDAAKVCKEFISRDPNEVRFSVIALTPTQD